MMSDVDMPLVAMRIQLASGINAIVQISRLRDGSRKVTHITEVIGFDVQRNEYITQDIYVRNYTGMDASGAVSSDFVPTGVVPQCVAQLREHGVDFPAGLYHAAQQLGY